MKTFRQFMVEAERPYDAQFMSGAQVVRTGGDGGRVGAERRKSTPERQRMRTVRNPETGALERKPAGPYKDRSDIGTQRPRSTREQQPTQERGSAEVTARSAAAIRAERIKAAKARAAAKKAAASGGTETTPAKPAASKPKPKDVEKQASELLSKAEPKPKPKPAASSGDGDNMIRGIYLPPGSPKRPYTRAERVGIERAAARLRKDIKSGTNRPAEFYKSYLKPGQLHASERK